MNINFSKNIILMIIVNKMEVVNHNKLFDNFEKCWTGTIVCDFNAKTCTYDNIQCHITEDNAKCIWDKMNEIISSDKNRFGFLILGYQTTSMYSYNFGCYLKHTRKFVWQ